MNKFRREIKRLLYLIYGISALLLLLLFNLSYRRNYTQSISRFLNMQFQMAGMLDNADSGSAAIGAKVQNGDYVIEDAGAENPDRLFLVSRDPAGVLRIVSTWNTNLTEDEILTVAREALNTHRRHGTVGNYQFETAADGTDLLVGAADISSLQARERKYLLLSLLAALAGFFLWRPLSERIAAKMLEPLAEAERKQKEFVMFAGHELKTPVAVMKASLAMMRSEGVQSRYLEDTEAENVKMEHLVTELLEFTRLDYQWKEQLREVDLSGLAEKSALSFDAYAYENGVTLDAETELELYIQGNEVALSRMLETLLENAIRHTPSGKGVQLRLESSREGAVLHIRNQGQEIPESEREKIFGLFYGEAPVETSGNTGEAPVETSGIAVEESSEASGITEEESAEAPENTGEELAQVSGIPGGSSSATESTESAERTEGSDGMAHFGLGLAIAGSIASRHHTRIQISCKDGWTDFYICFPVLREKKECRKEK